MSSNRILQSKEEITILSSSLYLSISFKINETVSLGLGVSPVLIGVDLISRFKKDEKGVVLEVQEEKPSGEGLKDITPIQTEDSKGSDGI